MNMQTRVRFAPSPTGHLHIGGLRVAIFNWLFAKHYNGKFLIRIEDTDLERSKQEYTNSILESFNWMQMQPDEDIVIQSSRLNEHKELIDKLLSEGKAYKCYCPGRDIAQLECKESYSRYEGKCRNLTGNNLSKDYVIRFKLPDESVITFDTINQTDNNKIIAFNDLIHGNIVFPLDQFDDFIIARSDGTPVYNFVVVADDNYMKISHVIRGEDHISNTPKQILLYKALGFEVPKFAHVPLILNNLGHKLSKRDAAVSVLEYKRQGYLSDALFNYLVRLGWSHGDQEVFTKSELINLFTLEAVGKKGSIFDVQKLNWYNALYLKQKSNDEILKLILLDVETNLYKLINFNQKQILQLIGLFKERVNTLKELVDQLINLSNAPNLNKNDFNAQAPFKVHFEQLFIQFESISDWNSEALSIFIKNFCKENQLKLPEVAQPIRYALTGSTSSPGVFELMAILGKDESLKRLRQLKKIF